MPTLAKWMRHFHRRQWFGGQFVLALQQKIIVNLRDKANTKGVTNRIIGAKVTPESNKVFANHPFIGSRVPRFTEDNDRPIAHLLFNDQ
uniref:hypothetical protein n=1 Tax=Vibrio cholerae TaxID=666 RepID=UPI003F58E9DD